MTIEFKPARRENVSLLIALAGASGSGKTMSALRLAQGIAAGGRIAMIDTEARRGLHYADQFDFLHCDMRAPFTPLAFSDVVARAQRDASASVVIIDSFSHEYDGEGGLIDHADRLAAEGTKSPGNWKEPKMNHRRLMRDLLQCRATLIFCLRADEKIAIERKEIEERGQMKMKTVVTPLGWTPICEKRFMYEMTASFTLDPSDPGKPKFHLPHKLQEQHRPFFQEGQFIDQRAGEQLAAWANTDGNATVGKPESDLPESLRSYIDHARDNMNACQTEEELKRWWGLEAPVRDKLDLVNTRSQGPKPGYRELFAAYAARVRELSA